MSGLPRTVENRMNRRLQTLLHADLGGITVTVRNISRSGAQAICEAAFYGALEPELRSSPVPLNMRLSGRALHLASTPVYVSEQGNEYSIRLEILDDGSEDWSSYQRFVDYLTIESDAH